MTSSWAAAVPLDQKRSAIFYSIGRAGGGPKCPAAADAANAYLDVTDQNHTPDHPLWAS